MTSTHQVVLRGIPYSVAFSGEWHRPALDGKYHKNRIKHTTTCVVTRYLNEQEDGRYVGQAQCSVADTFDPVVGDARALEAAMAAVAAELGLMDAATPVYACLACGHVTDAPKGNSAMSVHEPWYEFKREVLAALMPVRVAFHQQQRRERDAMPKTLTVNRRRHVNKLRELHREIDIMGRAICGVLVETFKHKK